MIDPKAVNAFIRAPRASHAWMKAVPDRYLDEELENLKFKPAKAEPLLNKHQKVCIILGIAHPAFAFWVDMGGGKTRIALELLNYHWKAKAFRYALIEAPSESALIGWENQIRLWNIGIPHIVLSTGTSSTDKWQEFNEFDEGLILVSYPGLVRMLTMLKKQKGKKKQKLIPDPKKIKIMQAKIGAVVYDEATKLMHHSSLAYRLNASIGKSIAIKMQLAGRPFGRDPQNLWSQLKLIDGGESLGETLGMFRAAFFEEKINYWGGYEYKFKKSMEKELQRIVQHRSITYRAEECIDLPKVVNSIEEVVLPGEAQAYYDQFVKELKRTHAGYTERKNSFLRMRQVSSGFVGLFDDESGDRIEIEFATNPKLERLMELIEEVPSDRKFIIWHEFIHSGRLICQALKERKIKHGWLRGGIKDARIIQDRFDHDPAYPGLVVNHRLGAYALNLQAANYDFVFESPVAALDREQMERRVARPGQLRRVFQTDLVCKGTADARILALHKEGGDLFKAIIADPRALEGLESLAKDPRKPAGGLRGAGHAS